MNGNKITVHNLRDRDRIVFGSQAHAVYYCLRKNSSINSQIVRALEEFPTATVDEYQMAIASTEEAVSEKAPAPD